jgi:hypothetical protein
LIRASATGRGFDMSRITEAVDAAPRAVPPPSGIAREAEIKYYTASQFQLMWWKFR